MKKLYKNPPNIFSGVQNVGIAFLTLFGTAQALNAQVSDYSFSQNAGTFSSIALNGTVVQGSEASATTTNDTEGWSVTIPFTFNFNGSDYTSIYVNSNGGATFGTTSNSSSVISASTSYSGAIGVMNRDLWGAFVTSGVTTSGSNVITNVAHFRGIEVGKILNSANGIPTGATITAFDETAGTITMSAPATSSSNTAVVRYGTGKVFTATEGTAPNRVFVIEWIGYNDYNATATGSNYLNFQLRLSETTNTVSTVYGPYFNINTTSRTNQIGLRGASNSDYNNRKGASGNPWDATTDGTANNSTVSRDNTNFPAPGLTFTWSPPTCLPPSTVTISNISYNTADISWNASSTVPSNGYAYYYSTSNTAPTASTTASGSSSTTSAQISGLSPLSTYYVWVRSVCSASDKSKWIQTPATFSTVCQPPAILSTTGATVCGASGTATISATAESGATITWYDAATAGTVLATGSSYTTPVINSNTTYYVSAQNTGIDAVGPLSPSSLGTISDSDYGIGTYYQKFDVTAPTTLQSVDVFPVSSVAIGTASSIEIRDNSGTTLVTVPYTVSVNDGVTPQTVTLNYQLPVGTGYRIGQGTGIDLNRNTSGATYPYTSNAITITGNNFSSGANYWYYIYNWRFSSVCESARQPVDVVVDSACLGTSETSGAKNTIKAYPNPFSDVLSLSDISNILSVSVLDISGKVVRNYERPESSFNLKDLNSGMYILLLKMKDGSRQSIKVIKK